jgi:hypothetical protein
VEQKIGEIWISKARNVPIPAADDFSKYSSMGLSFELLRESNMAMENPGFIETFPNETSMNCRIFNCHVYYQRVPNLDSSYYLPVLLYHLVLDFWVDVLMDKRLVVSCI